MSALDTNIGPQLLNAIDFTTLFEQSILMLLPAALFILYAMYQIGVLWNRPNFVTSPKLLGAKMIAAGFYVSLQIVMIGLWSTSPEIRNQISIAQASIGVIGSLASTVLAYHEHRASIRPSFVLGAYLFLTSMLDLPLARTLWTRGSTAMAIVFTASLAAKIVLLCLEELPKEIKDNNNNEPIPRELRAGFISKCTFWWLNPMMLSGAKRIIDMDDLDSLLPKLDSARLLKTMENAWDKQEKPTKNSLAKCSVWALRAQAAQAVLPRLLLVCFTLSQPFLVTAVVHYVGRDASARDPKVAAALIGATMLTNLGVALSKAIAQHMAYQFSVMMRGGLVSLIFRKTLQLDPLAIKEAAPVTLMSSDVDAVFYGMKTMQELWAGVIELAASVWLLYLQLGYPALLFLIPCTITTIATTTITPIMAPAKVAWLGATQKRVGETSNMLSQMKGVKMLGLTDYFQRHIHNLRVFELGRSSKYRKIHACTMPFTEFSETVTPIIVIIAAILWTKRDEGLTIAEAFTSLSLMNIAYQPIELLVYAMMGLFPCLGAFSRIQEYLLSDAHIDSRKIASTPDAESPNTNSSSDASATEVEKVTTHTVQPAQLAEFKTPVDLEKQTDFSIRIVHASFIVLGDKEVLHDICLEITPETLNMIVGRVGSGKTSLLKAVAGEMGLKSGTIQTATSSIGYCDQKPWVKNISIRENIVGQSKYEEDWMKKVLHATALDEDVALFPAGDDTLVGTGGVALSGGQRQRVAVARAIYAREPIVVMDDVFSGLDNKTARTVFRRVFGPSGLLRSNTTVLLATNNTKFLPAANHITMLDNGRIVRNQVAYSEFPPSEWGLDNDDEEDSGESIVDEPSNDDEDNRNSPPEAVKQRVELLAALEAKKVQMDLTRQTGDIDCYKIYIKSMGIHNAVGYTILAILGVSSCFIPQIILRLWTQKGANPTDYGWMAGYVTVGLSAMVLATLDFVFFMVRNMPVSSIALHKSLLNVIMRAPLSFFSKVDSGITLNRFSQDMNLVDTDLPLGFLNTVFFLFRLLFQIGLIASGATYAAIMLPFSILAVYLIQNFYLRTSRQMRFLDIEAKSPLFTQFSETVAGLSTIRALGWSKSAILENLRLLNISQQPFYTMNTIQRWLQLVLDLWVGGMATVLVAISVCIPASSSRAAIGLSLATLIAVNANLNYLMYGWTRLETSLGAIARLKWFQNNTPCEDKPEEIVEPESDWPRQGKVVFEHVTARYSEDGVPILNNISFTIEPGQKVGVCGRTGSGKSSLIATLLRLIEIDPSGQITVDSMPLTTIPRQLTRTRMTTLPQDGVHFLGTVRHNLDPENNIQADEPLIAALKKTSMWNVIEPQGGLDADLDELGLSTGQMQLFCLARVILRRGSQGGVVLLDEATSSVDRRTDDEVRAAIRSDLDGRTVIEVAHRLEIVKDYDVIIVMGAGDILEMGAPGELLSRPSSAFKSLWEQQRPLREILSISLAFILETHFTDSTWKSFMFSLANINKSIYSYVHK